MSFERFTAIDYISTKDPRHHSFLQQIADSKSPMPNFVRGISRFPSFCIYQMSSDTTSPKGPDTTSPKCYAFKKEFLAEGNFGKAYLYKSHNNIELVIKKMKNKPGSILDQRKKYNKTLREAKLMKLYGDVGEVLKVDKNEDYYLVMKNGGQDLYQWLFYQSSNQKREKLTQKNPFPTFADFLKFKLEIYKQVYILHGALGIAHLDLHPGNIGIDKENKITLYDFGLAKKFKTQDDEGESVLPIIIDKPEKHYFPPEFKTTKGQQPLVPVQVDPSQDIYMLGHLLEYTNQYLLEQTEHGFKGSVLISSRLDKLHKTMVSPNPKERPTIVDVIKTCIELYNKHSENKLSFKKDFEEPVMALKMNIQEKRISMQLQEKKDARDNFNRANEQTKRPSQEYKNLLDILDSKQDQTIDSDEHINELLQLLSLDFSWKVFYACKIAITKNIHNETFSQYFNAYLLAWFSVSDPDHFLFYKELKTLQAEHKITCYSQTEYYLLKLVNSPAHSNEQSECLLSIYKYSPETFDICLPMLLTKSSLILTDSAKYFFQALADTKNIETKSRNDMFPIIEILIGKEEPKKHHADLILKHNAEYPALMQYAKVFYYEKYYPLYTSASYDAKTEAFDVMFSEKSNLSDYKTTFGKALFIDKFEQDHEKKNILGEKFQAALGFLSKVISQTDKDSSLKEPAMAILKEMTQAKNTINNKDFPLATQIVYTTIKCMACPEDKTHLDTFKTFESRIKNTSLDACYVTSTLQNFLQVLYMFGRAVGALLGSPSVPRQYNNPIKKPLETHKHLAFFFKTASAKYNTSELKNHEEKKNIPS